MPTTKFLAMMTLNEIIDEIHQSREERMMTQLMTIDQSSVFDCMNHILLLRKLK